MAELKWWQKAVFYQIYLRSFADGNGDGIGDFPGMIDKLDYLVKLGIDAIWLSPHYPSPMWDCGYDISDYCSVAPEYGTLDDFKRFLNGAHERGLRVILDLVLNHSSDKHAWFLESRSSRDNPKADWYLWEDQPPNNWQSCFDGPAWTYDEARGQYYYHYFMKQQPDLNWANPEVKHAMWAVVRFWLDLGVDGYRLDALGTIYEHPERPDHPVQLTLAELRRASELASTARERKKVEKYWGDMFQYQWGRPHELMKELRSILDEYEGDRMLVGEDDDISYHGDGDDELHLVFNFPLMRTDRLTPEHFRANQADRLAALGKLSPPAWPCNTLGNHDSPRLYTSFRDRLHNAELARLHLASLLTLKGTPFLYNGEEVGMTDLKLTDISHFRDTMGIWYYHAAVDELGIAPPEALKRAAVMTRDKNRTPMQWSNSPNAGFCPRGIQPWLLVNPDFSCGVNVRDQENDPNSLLNFYRRMLHVRKATPALVEGDYHEVPTVALEEVLAFKRETPGQTVLVMLNYSNQARTLDLSSLGRHASRLLFSSAGRSRRELSLDALQLGPYEVLITEL
ncbi:MAG: alpha-glucosidase [Chloroflexota bacterium]